MEAVQQWAGEGACARGEQYFLEGRLRVERGDDGAIRGTALGAQRYALWLQPENGEWRWHCDCPAAADGAFCKHLVAAVLQAANDAWPAGARAGEARGESPAADGLLDFLRAQPTERLAGWLHELACDDREVAKRLQLYRAAEQPGALKAALGKLLATGGWLDYRRAMQYARRLDAGIAQLRGVLARDPAECRTLCEYALKRLFKVYSDGADDSSGAIGERLAEIAGLYASACNAAPPGKALVKPLLALKALDGWDMLPLAQFWPALEPAGQADYARRVLMEFQALPPPAPGNRYGESFEVLHRTEELARCARDFELLQRVLRRDLGYPRDHLKVLDSLREFGREREALAWAETAARKFPDATELRLGLAGCLAAAGMRDEAVVQCWQCFVASPSADHWDALKEMAGEAWPDWRRRALEQVAAHESGSVSTRLDLLLHDDDGLAAIELAQHARVELRALLRLAQAVQQCQPDAAGAFYLRVARANADAPQGVDDYRRLVGYLQRAAGLGQRAAVHDIVGELRERHRRKPRLMTLLTEGGF